MTVQEEIQMHTKNTFSVIFQTWIHKDCIFLESLWVFSLGHFMHLRLIQDVMQPNVNGQGCLLPQIGLGQHTEV